jgi:hypothetical protein
VDDYEDEQWWWQLQWWWLAMMTMTVIMMMMTHDATNLKTDAASATVPLSSLRDHVQFKTKSSENHHEDAQLG